MKLKKLIILLIKFLFIVLILLLLVPTVYPTSLNSDRGIFESVSYRLIAGDELYSQVWDNKDPIFYYLNSLALSISPTFDLYLELFLIFGISIVLYKINENITKSEKVNFMFSFLLAPLLIINFGYSAGYTHLPGVFIIFLILYFLIINKPIFIGVFLTLLFFTKILFFPIALLIIFIKYRNGRNEILVTIKFFFLTYLVINLLLIIRGEFLGYYKSLYLNFEYTSTNVELFKRLQIMFEIKDIILIVFIMFLTLATRVKTNQLHKQYYQIQVTIGMFALGIVLLITTGRVNHHIQILTPFILLSTSNFLFLYLKDKAWNYTFIFIFVTILFWHNHLLNFQKNWNYLEGVYSNDLSEAPEANLLLKERPSGRYARLGQNDDNAHAKNLGNWKLVCPRFHQYPHESENILGMSLDCIIKSDYLIISPTFKTYVGFAEWNKFVNMGNIIVGQNFSCKDYSYTTIRICENFKRGS